mgnify:CR=1 FL=1
MKETADKIKRQAEFTRQHTLTESDLRKLISEKFERARAYHNAKNRKKQEATHA